MSEIDIEKAKELVRETEAAYERQVAEGCYLCDKPFTLDDAIEHLKNK